MTTIHFQFNLVKFVLLTTFCHDFCYHYVDVGIDLAAKANVSHAWINIPSTSYNVQRCGPHVRKIQE